MYRKKIYLGHGDVERGESDTPGCGVVFPLTSAPWMLGEGAGEMSGWGEGRGEMSGAGEKKGLRGDMVGIGVALPGEYCGPAIKQSTF